jgi:tetratricopeptide (TPR) repeat protein
MKWIQLFTAVTTALVALGCTHSQTKEEENLLVTQQQKVLKDFEHANELFDAGKFADAADAYDKVVQLQPSPDVLQMVIYNGGLAYLQSSDCLKAAEHLRHVTRLAHQTLPQLEGRALLRLADAFTCLGQENKAVSTLLQLSRGKFNLPIDTIETEIPAKLAGSYARLGNTKEAENYFRIAERGLNKMQDAVRDTQRRDEMARILFLMGNLNQINTKTMRSHEYFSTVIALQKYLLKSVELDSKLWSTQSRDVIVQAYRQIWDYVDNVEAPKGEDATLSSRQQKLAQISLAEEAIQGLKELRRDHTPTTNEPDIFISLMNRLRGEELKLKNFIATNIIGTNLTPEALAAQGLKRMGRVLNPDPILENLASQRERKPISARKNYTPKPIQAPEEE